MEKVSKSWSAPEEKSALQTTAIWLFLLHYIINKHTESTVSTAPCLILKCLRVKGERSPVFTSIFLPHTLYWTTWPTTEPKRSRPKRGRPIDWSVASKKLSVTGINTGIMQGDLITRSPRMSISQPGSLEAIHSLMGTLWITDLGFWSCF